MPNESGYPCLRLTIAALHLQRTLGGLLLGVSGVLEHADARVGEMLLPQGAGESQVCVVSMLHSPLYCAVFARRYVLITIRQR